ncbi:hypothetical protein WAK64_02395 [Bacillus spongiae]|uniref:Uncharacterized protein n=1 Tax=Bacillus spongiae TaxID=2683610 RepID=A0ABU8H9C3_9BACI
MKNNKHPINVREEYGVETADLNAVKLYEITSKENQSIKVTKPKKDKEKRRK